MKTVLEVGLTKEDSEIIVHIDIRAQKSGTKPRLNYAHFPRINPNKCPEDSYTKNMDNHYKNLIGKKLIAENVASNINFFTEPTYLEIANENIYLIY